MLTLLFYFAVAVVAMIWCISDTNATGAFEVLRRNLHATARDMGLYRKWLIYSLSRCIVLFTLVGLSTSVTFWLLKQNPFRLGQLSRSIAFGAMLVGSLGLLSLPHVFAKVRFQRYLFSKAAELSKLASLFASEDELLQNLESADYHTEAGWTAWHPKQTIWQQDACWAGIVPVVYLRRQPASSLIVPVDWVHFLAWNLPSESVIPGHCLPVHGPGETTFNINSAYELRGRPGWSVIRTDMEIEAA